VAQKNACDAPAGNENVPAAVAQEGSTASVNVIPLINTPSVFVTVIRQNAVEPGAFTVEATQGPIPPTPQSAGFAESHTSFRIANAPTVTDADEGGVVTGGTDGLPGIGADAVVVFVTAAPIGEVEQ
jgi:hypothetical protein